MFQMNDNLFDPCPQCALKHLRAAYAEAVLMAGAAGWRDAALKSRLAKYKDEPGPGEGAYVDPRQLEAAIESYGEGVTWLSVALVNFIEARQGYGSHFDYALGCMTRAEENFAGGFAPELSKTLRELRIGAAMTGDAGPVVRFLQGHVRQHGAGLLSVIADPYVGHLTEAGRELPAVHEKIRSTDCHEYIDLSPASAWLTAEGVFGDDALTGPETIRIPMREAAWAVSALVRLSIDSDMADNTRPFDALGSAITYVEETYFSCGGAPEGTDRPDDPGLMWLMDREGGRGQHADKGVPSGKEGE